MVYSALSVFCAFAPFSVTQRIYSIVWVLGPPANLLHGTAWILPFILGTIVVAAVSLAAARATGLLMRVVWLLVGLMMWCLFGALVYAPGA